MEGGESSRPVTPVTLRTGEERATNGREEETATGKRHHESSPTSHTALETAALEPSPKKQKGTDGSSVALRLSPLIGSKNASHTHVADVHKSSGAVDEEGDNAVISAAVAAAAAAAERATPQLRSHSLSMTTGGQERASPAVASHSLPATHTPGVTHSPGVTGVTYTPGVTYSPGVIHSPGVTHSGGVTHSPGVTYSPGVTGVTYTPGVTYSPGVTHPPRVTYSPGVTGVTHSPGVILTPGVSYSSRVTGVSYSPGVTGFTYSPGVPHSLEGEYSNGIPLTPGVTYAPVVPGAMGVRDEQNTKGQLEERAKALAEAKAQREREREEKKRLTQMARDAEKLRKQKEREEAKRLREEEKERKKEEARIAREIAAKERARVKEEEKRAKALRQEEEKKRRAEEKAKKLEEEKRAKEERKAAKIAEKKRLQEEKEREKVNAAKEAEEQQKKQWDSWGFGKPRPEPLPDLEASDAALPHSPVKAIVLQRHITGATVRAKLSLKEIDRKAFDHALRNGKADVVHEFRRKLKELRAARVKQCRKGSPMPSLPHLSCMKLLAFHENTRPPYYGTASKTPEGLRHRNPFARAPALDYDVDSEEEWEEDAEDIEKSDGEEDLEEEDEEGDFIVPDDYLSDDERENCDMDGTVPSKGDPVKKRETLGTAKAIVDGIHFSLPDKSPLKAYSVVLLPHMDTPSPSVTKRSPTAAAKELPEEQLRHLATILHNSILSRPAIITAFREKFPSAKKQRLNRAIMAISTRASSRAPIKVNQDVLTELGLAQSGTEEALPAEKKGPSIEETMAVKKTIAKGSPGKRTKQAHLLPVKKDSSPRQQAQLVIVLDDADTACPPTATTESKAGTAGGGVPDSYEKGTANASGVVGLSVGSATTMASPVNMLVPKKKPRKVAPTTVSPQPSATSPKGSPAITNFFGKPKGN